MFEKHPRSTGRQTRHTNSTVLGVAPPGEILLELPLELSRGQRGAVIADNWGLSGAGDTFCIEWLEPNMATLRMALLFNDTVDLPHFAVELGPPDPLQLEESGQIHRTKIAMNGVVQFKVLDRLECMALEALNGREPGAWSLWHEPNFDPIPLDLHIPNAAVRLALQNAILVPSLEVPLEEVILFRDRNSKLLRNLRLHLDDLAVKIACGGPDPALARLEIEKLELAIAEYTEEARKPNWKKALGGLELSIDWTQGFAQSIGPAAAMAATAGIAGLPLAQVTGMLGVGIAAALGLKSTRSLKGARKDSPFEYIARIEQELDIGL